MRRGKLDGGECDVIICGTGSAGVARPLVVSYFRDSFDLRVAELGELAVSQGAALFTLEKMGRL